MKYIAILIGIFFLGNSSFAQIQVSGKVRGESGDVLPGTIILEKGTINGVTSNLDGYFLIECVTEKPTLVFNFVGTESQEISIEKDTVLNVVLIDNIELEGQQIIYCGIPRRVYRIGLNTGINYNQLGVETQNILPRLLHFLPFRNNIYSNFKWRFLTKSKYLKFEIGQFGVLRIGDETRLGLEVNYQQISLTSSKFSNRQFSVSTIIGIKGWNTSIGYARREIKNHEDLNNSQNGIALGLGKTLFERVYFKADAVYWSDDWQYNFHLDANIPKTRINLGFDYEKVNSFEEFGISILYSFYYY